jgi:hypothetical protein
MASAFAAETLLYFYRIDLQAQLPWRAKRQLNAFAAGRYGPAHNFLKFLPCFLSYCMLFRSLISIILCCFKTLTLCDILPGVELVNSSWPGCMWDNYFSDRSHGALGASGLPLRHRTRSRNELNMHA